MMRHTNDGPGRSPGSEIVRFAQTILDRVLDDDDPLEELLNWIRPKWHRDAACKEVTGVNFFPERGGDVRPALAVCRSCLVRAECEAAGVDGKEYGVWGGTTASQRRVMRREGREAA